MLQIQAYSDNISFNTIVQISPNLSRSLFLWSFLVSNLYEILLTRKCYKPCQLTAFELSLINIPYAKFYQYSTPCCQQRDAESRLVSNKQGANRIFV